jgi:hypothetical protein
LGRERDELIYEGVQRLARAPGQRGSLFGDPFDETPDVLWPTRPGDAELGKVSADRVHEGDPLTGEQLVRSVDHARALLLERLHRRRADVRPSCRLTDGRGVGDIVLLPRDVWLDEGWRDEPHLMPERLEFACPVVRGSAGL